MHVNKKKTRIRIPDVTACGCFIRDSIYNASDRIQRENVLGILHSFGLGCRSGNSLYRQEK